MDIEEIINKLTENGKYDEGGCLLFLLDNMDHYLKYLLSINLTGKRLDNLFYKGCEEFSLECFSKTIR